MHKFPSLLPRSEHRHLPPLTGVPAPGPSKLWLAGDLDKRQCNQVISLLESFSWFPVARESSAVSVCFVQLSGLMCSLRHSYTSLLPFLKPSSPSLLKRGAVQQHTMWHGRAVSAWSSSRAAQSPRALSHEMWLVWPRRWAFDFTWVELTYHVSLKIEPN